MSNAGQQSRTERQRYAKESSTTKGTISGKLIAIFALVMVIAFAFALVKFFQAEAKSTITGETATVEQIDENAMRVVVDITRKDTSVPTYCIVTALDYDINEVGRREVVIPAGGETTERIAVEVPTRATAVSGDVYGCSDIIPFYMDTSEAARDSYTLQ